MENQHLTYFKVENFKKFDSLEVKGIGQFNLIVGDNNVGKTCLLEALSLGIKHKEIISNLYNILSHRKDSDYYYKIIKNTDPSGNIKNLHSLLEDSFNFENNIITPFLAKGNDYFKYIYNDVEILIENKFIELNIESQKIANNKYIFDFVEKHELFSYREINKKSRNWIFISKKNVDKKEFQLDFMVDITSGYYFDFFSYKLFHNIIYFSNKISNEKILKYESIISDYETKKEVINLLNSIFELQILDFNFSSNDLKISTKKNGKYKSIREYGDGIQRFILFVLEMLINENGKLFFDEIEVGIHFSKIKKLWKTIFELAQKYNVQIFATTHSEECIQAFYEASKQLNEQKDIRLISLQEGEKEKIYSTTYNFENIEAGLYSNIELRA
ncbi:AAA family ATPase [Chryseobacterium viscerum]|uniref:AAA family ATPase n=1 Tax=Chryseobacterium viscerum TaxID=1037377 RepID=A0A5N4BNV2_9FLAO|nr:ATP-binding protein [Chryseobacterium viscerum]KAB1229785.1 AAA family ATPase [Chryseobacterium viscerum]